MAKKSAYEYMFNVAIIGPKDKVNEKFVVLVAPKHGNVDGVHFHVGTVENVVINFWQPHWQAESKKLVNLTYQTANAIIIVLPKKDMKLEEKYKEIIQDFKKEMPVGTFIMRSGPKLQEKAKKLLRKITLEMKSKAEASKQKETEKDKAEQEAKKFEERAGDPIYYLDRATGLVTITRSKGAIPLFLYAEESEENDKKKKKKLERI